MTEPHENWTETDANLPPPDTVVMTMDSGGACQKLQLHKGLWFFEDMSMYVYYTPKRWKLLEETS